MSDSTQPPKKHLLSMGLFLARGPTRIPTWGRKCGRASQGTTERATWRAAAGYHDADIVVELLDPMDKPQSVWAFDVAITELHNLDNRFVEKEQSMAVAADLV